MTAGFIQTELQDSFRTLNLYFPRFLFMHNPAVTHHLSTLSSTCGMTNCIGTGGVKVYMNKSQLRQTLPACRCFKGELDIKHATR